MKKLILFAIIACFFAVPVLAQGDDGGGGINLWTIISAVLGCLVLKYGYRLILLFKLLIYIPYSVF